MQSQVHKNSIFFVKSLLQYFKLELGMLFTAFMFRGKHTREDEFIEDLNATIQFEGICWSKFVVFNL